jgi:hypothetical protein
MDMVTGRSASYSAAPGVLALGRKPISGLVQALKDKVGNLRRLNYYSQNIVWLTFTTLRATKHGFCLHLLGSHG